MSEAKLKALQYLAVLVSIIVLERSTFLRHAHALFYLYPTQFMKFTSAEQFPPGPFFFLFGNERAKPTILISNLRYFFYEM